MRLLPRVVPWSSEAVSVCVTMRTVVFMFVAVSRFECFSLQLPRGGRSTGHILLSLELVGRCFVGHRGGFRGVVRLCRVRLLMEGSLM